MASVPLNWLLKIGGATLKTTAKTLSEAVNTLHDTVTNLSTTVTNLGTSKADASTTTTALNNLETNKLNISDLLSLEEIEASTSLTGKGVTAESIKSLNNSLGGVSQFIVDETTGKITGYKTEIGGADTVFPFNTLTFIGNSDSQYVRTFSIASIDNNYSEYTASNFIINVTNVIRKDNVTEYQSTASLIKSYDSNTGILTINKVLHGNQWNEYGLYLKYEVYIRT